MDVAEVLNRYILPSFPGNQAEADRDANAAGFCRPRSRMSTSWRTRLVQHSYAKAYREKTQFEPLTRDRKSVV